MTLTGEMTTLYTFCTRPGCPDGGGPNGIVQASDGNFYGTTSGGGGGYSGSLYRLTPSGALSVLHTFPPDYSPAAGPVQGSDGNIYGTSLTTVFKAGLDGSFETIHQFCSLPGCADGNWAVSPLIQATDGNLYGTTYEGGAHDGGTIFRMVPPGTLQATNGDLYGMAENKVYRLSMGLAPFVSPLPAYGSIGGNITILGYKLTGATAVTFSGAAASFTVNATGTAITATVPPGATTGSIQVTLADGSTLSSNVPFQVTQ